MKLRSFILAAMISALAIPALAQDKPGGISFHGTLYGDHGQTADLSIIGSYVDPNMIIRLVSPAGATPPTSCVIDQPSDVVFSTSQQINHDGDKMSGIVTLHSYNCYFTGPGANSLFTPTSMRLTLGWHLADSTYGLNNDPDLTLDGTNVDVQLTGFIATSLIGTGSITHQQ